MKYRFFVLLVLGASTLVVGDDSDRRGIFFSAGLQPDFSYLLVSTSLAEYHDWYSQYLGGCSVELRLGYSRTGKDVSSFVTNFTWKYPSGLFVYSLFGGYGYTHYIQPTAPCFLYDINGGLSITNTAGLDRSSPAIGTKAGFRIGYELNKHWAVMVGTCFGGEVRNSSIIMTGIDRNDLSNTIKNYGYQGITDIILNNSIGLMLSYLIY